MSRGLAVEALPDHDSRGVTPEESDVPAESNDPSLSPAQSEQITGGLSFEFPSGRFVIVNPLDSGTEAFEHVASTEHAYDDGQAQLQNEGHADFGTDASPSYEDSHAAIEADYSTEHAAIDANYPTERPSTVRNASADLSSDNQRHVHIAIEDADEGHMLPIESGLSTEVAYRLHVGLSQIADPLLVGQARKLSKPVGQEVKFQVAVISRSPELLMFSTSVGSLTWTADDSVLPAEFNFITHQPGTAQFDVLIHQDCDLLFMATVEAEVARPGAAWSLPIPIRWLDN